MTKVVVFDLGNIVIQFTGPEDIRKNYFPEETTEALIERWCRSEANLKHETGQIDEEQFIDMFLEEWQLPIHRDDFIPIYNSWMKAPYDGMPELLTQLSSKYILACLSNTNAVHWKHLEENYRLSQYFQYQFLSHEMGIMKPHPEIYTRVAQTLDVSPADIVFFDDLKENVEAAQAVGINAHQVKGYDQVYSKCMELELL